MYLKNRIIIFFYFFISFCLSLFSFHFLHISLFRFALVDFVLLSLASFHFVFISLISFRFVSFRFDFVDFVSFRFYFVSHITGTHKNTDKVIFEIRDLLKQSRPAYHKGFIEMKCFSENENICVVHTLYDYIDRKKNIRKNCSKLLISYQKPFKPVSKDTISR